MKTFPRRICTLAPLLLSLSPLAADTTRYIVFNRAPGQGMDQARPESLGRAAFDEVLTRFPNLPDNRVQTAVSHIFSVFRTPPETTVKALRAFLAAAESTSTPVVVQIDTEHWWEARPDLWNWWDAARPGYDPANRANVEWTGWSPDQAVKIAWRNWGRQLRVLPPPNLASPRYLEACRVEIRRLVPIVLEWESRLPEAKRNLLIGIKLGHETSIGANAYHYAAGNDLLAEPAQDDPLLPFAAEDVLTRGRAQIGYAAAMTSGIRTSGPLTESDLRDVCQRYLAALCREAARLGVPRQKLFAHGVGWKDGELLYDAPVNADACPGWSFYKHAADPAGDAGVRRNLARSDAPYWAACEYWLAADASAWRDALAKTFSDPRCRYICVFNWESLIAHPTIIDGIREFVTAPASSVGPMRPIHTNFLFRDTRSQRQFWLAATLFDPRGATRFPDTVHVDNWEGGTHLPILFSALNRNSRWLHPGPGSSLFTDTPFDHYRRMIVRVGPGELRAAIAAMRRAIPALAAASEDPRDYQLIHFNINPEVSAPRASRGRLGLSLRDIRVELLAP